MYVYVSPPSPPLLLLCCHFTRPIDNAANSKANIEATKLSLFSLRCCFALITSRCPCLPSTPAKGSGAGQDCRTAHRTRHCHFKASFRLRLPRALVVLPPRINKHFVGFQFVRFQFATCHMPHGHLPPRLPVPSAGSAASSVLSSAACDRQSSAGFLSSISLNLPLSLPLPHFLSHSHSHPHIARFLWPLTSVFFLFHSFADFHFACRFLLFSLFSHSDCFFPLVPLCFFFCFFCLCFSFIIAAPRRR